MSVRRGRVPASRVLAGLLALVALLALVGCGEKQEGTTPGAGRPFRLVLDFFPNANHVGIYAAQADGDFAAAGLAVKIESPGDPAAPLRLLAAGRADLVISYEPEVLLARAKGLRVVSVAALVQRPLTSIVALDAKRIRTPADLRGKRVGTAGIPYQSAYLRTILARAGVPARSVRETSVGFDLIPAMLGRKVDATLGAYWNYEAIQLEQKGKRPRVIPVDRAGVPTYDELVLVARQDTLPREGAKVRSFLQAVARGYRAARADPARAVGQLVRANPDLDRRLQLASVKRTLPLFFPAAPGKPWGYADPARWQAFGDWMLAAKLVTRPPRAASALTNEFLPGEGL